MDDFNIELEDKAYEIIRTPIGNGIFTTLSYAQSLDGFICQKGKRTVISCDESLILTHAIRASRDAILVGVSTCLIDNPSLTTRKVKYGPNKTEPKNPIPVVLDTHLDLPDSSRFIGNAVILTSFGASEERKNQLEAKGARVFRVALNNHNRIDIVKGFECLYSIGIRSIMVEGGAKIIQEFMRIEYVDELIVTIGPIVLGEGVSSTGNGSRLQLKDASWHQFGTDIILSSKCCKMLY